MKTKIIALITLLSATAAFGQGLTMTHQGYGCPGQSPPPTNKVYFTPELEQ